MRGNIFSKLMCGFLTCTLLFGHLVNLDIQAYALETGSGEVTYTYTESTHTIEGSDGSEYYAEIDLSTYESSYDIEMRGLTTEQSAFVIPASIDSVYYVEWSSEWAADFEIRSIAADTFEGCDNLKYIKLEMSQSDFNKISNGALNFSSAENLETIYVNCEVTDAIEGKFEFGDNSSVRILQYVDLSAKDLIVSTSKYEDGNVEIVFDDIDAQGYRVLRSMGENEEPVTFDSNDIVSLSNFNIQNGVVTFTDASVEEGNTYNYVITAYEFFGSSASDNTEVVVPLPDISSEVIELEQDVYTYTGMAIEPEVVIEGVDESYYTVEYRDNVNAGTATVTITGQNKYAGSVEKTFTINPADINGKTVTLESELYEYDGMAKRPSVTIEGLSADDYTVEYTNNMNPGNATVTITGKGNYKGTITKTFVINPAKKDDEPVTEPIVKPVVAPEVESVAKPEVKSQKTVNVRLAIGNGAYDDICVKWSSQSVKGATVKYKVEYKVAGGKWENALKSTYTTKTSLTKKNLAAGKKYYFKVTPCVEVNGVLYSGKAKTSGYVYTLKELKKPNARRLASGKIKLTWENINGETGYQIAKSSYKNKKFKVIRTIKNAKAKAVTLKVNKNKKYYYKVRAYKIVNKKKVYGPWSEAKEFALK